LMQSWSTATMRDKHEGGSKKAFRSSIPEPTAKEGKTNQGAAVRTCNAWRDVQAISMTDTPAKPRPQANMARSWKFDPKRAVRVVLEQEPPSFRFEREVNAALLAVYAWWPTNRNRVRFGCT
jgi:hypothetical protein